MTTQRPLVTGARRANYAVMALLAVLFGGLSYALSARLSSVLVQPAYIDVYFDGDISRVYQNMLYRDSNHYKARVHPLFSLSAFPPVFVLNRGLDVDERTSVRIVMGLWAGLWAATLFALCRTISRHSADAVAWTIAGAMASCSLFWTTVPETYCLGSFTILAMLLFVAHYDGRESPRWLCAVMSGATLSITVTNWMTGIVSSIAQYGVRHAIQISANALVIVTVLWAVQDRVFTNADFFLASQNVERRHMAHNQPLQVIRTFAFHSVVMPKPTIEPRIYPKPANFPPSVFRVQNSAIASGSLMGKFAAGIWVLLLALGALEMWKMTELRGFRICLSLTLAGQLALHLVYGLETFLYSLNFGPLLILVAAFASRADRRTLVLSLTTIFVLCLAWNNHQQLISVTELLESGRLAQAP